MDFPFSVMDADINNVKMLSMCLTGLFKMGEICCLDLFIVYNFKCLQLQIFTNFY